jgi:5'-deoxynucleotidase YfbR-like HD superfamily hydrolase
VSALRDPVVQLAQVVLRFGRVDRITFHEDGMTPESDTDHTVMVAMVACALAERIAPELDLGEVAQEGLGHDLTEVFAGDTPTLRLPSAELAAAKRTAERAAFDRLTAIFGRTLPWVTTTIARYEGRHTRASDFIWIVDKICAKLTHVQNVAAGPRVQGVDADELAVRYKVQRQQVVQRAAGEWPELIELYDVLVEEELTLLRRHPLPPMLPQVSEYTLCHLPEDHPMAPLETVTVQRWGGNRWVVHHGVSQQFVDVGGRSSWSTGREAMDGWRSRHLMPLPKALEVARSAAEERQRAWVAQRGQRH